MAVLHTHGNQEVILQGVRKFAITPSDTVDITIPGASLYCNADMTVNLMLVEDTSAGVMKLSKGYHPLKVKRVYLTDTSLGDETLFGVV